MFRPRHFWLLPLGLILCLPVLAILGSWGAGSVQSWASLSVLWQTVLPEYALTSILLCVLVAVGVGGVGVATACAVTLFDFPGRRTFEWALLLPLAIPAYVMAYAYTDFLQYSGPAQTWLRAVLGVQGRVLPEVRSLGGAAWVFVFSLYPYVYLLARAALADRAAHLMEAARVLGVPLKTRMRKVAVPLARPAVAAGIALALMETLADFGVASYFGIQTFSVGVYKAWLAYDDRIAAAQLATFLLLFVGAFLLLERRAQATLRFASARGHGGGAKAAPYRLQGVRIVQVWVVCVVPIVAGFALPVAFMLRPLVQGWGDMPWPTFWSAAKTSVALSFGASVLTVSVAVALAHARRQSSDWLTRSVVRLSAMGYAVPGAVIVVGLLLPTAWLQRNAPGLDAGYWLGATVIGVLWAYLVRFSAVALQSVQAGYTRIPASFDESARMMGASPWATWLHVHWPLLKRPIAVATLLVWVDVMKELPATMVLRPFNSDTLAVLAYQLARDERLGEAALPALAIVLVGLLPVVLLSRTLRGETERTP